MELSDHRIKALTFAKCLRINFSLIPLFYDHWTPSLTCFHTFLLSNLFAYNYAYTFHFWSLFPSFKIKIFFYHLANLFWLIKFYTDQASQALEPPFSCNILILIIKLPAVADHLILLLVASWISQFNYFSGYENAS